MAVDPAIIGIALQTVTQGANAFQQYAPRLADIRKGDRTDPGLIGDVRMGEVAAITLTVGVGAIASSLTGSPVPTMVAAIICLVMVMLYEAALRGENLFEPKSGPRVVAPGTEFPEGY